ncbi:hypothetical protein SESBI_01034 [Sesbania bispinosa]|nr:hypothetical protein SESBI_01034 [Sesbania bispinosa]
MEEERVMLSQEEMDNLRRSMKKRKHIVAVESSGDTFVKETPLAGIQGASSSIPIGNHVLFSTATGQKIIRGVVSYKDICLESSPGGNDGDGGSDDDSYSSSDSEEDDSDLQAFLAECDPLCPIVKISRHEKKLSIPWRRAIIVKLLGKRIGLKMLQSRLSKLWQPTSSMDIIDLENDYFLICFSNNDDLNHVFEFGLWMIMGHYLVEVASPDEGFGPWMLVQKGGRRPRSGHVGNAVNAPRVQSSTAQVDKSGNGSRFSILENEGANQEEQVGPKDLINVELMLDDTVKGVTNPRQTSNHHSSNDGVIIKDRRESIHNV